MLAHVTGANGFIGTHLIHHLDAKGWSATAACRRPTNFGGSVNVCSAEMHCHADSVVFHLAGRAHRTVRTRDVDLYQQDNCDEALASYRRAVQASANAFIFLSSARVIGESSSMPLADDAEPNPVGAYAASKHRAEVELARLNDEYGLPLAIVRPPLVYGPGVKANFLKLLSWSRRPWPLPVGCATALRSMVYVGNLVDLLEILGHRVAAHRAKANVWHVKDSEDLDVASLTRRLAQIMGSAARVVPVPRSAVDLVARVFGQKQLAGQLFDPFQIDDGRTRERLDWAPPTSVDDGLRTTVEWFLREC
ncbi:MAG: NAD-dependent epimerase/dehydratase family protein [Gammaproteobacteria bacterium]|nr:NAD-dependent epimerase/dehydratase family protein [Gammaproteobacteria bacterium]